MSEATVAIIEAKALQRVFGDSDIHLRTIRDALAIQVTVDGSRLLLRGDDEAVRKGTIIFDRLQRFAVHGHAVVEDDVRRALSEVQSGQEISGVRPIEVFTPQPVRPKTAGQARYLEKLRRKDIVFAVGPAGTGKTYIAVARAVELFRQDRVKKIVLVRPAVEAGESLGFLPGDLQAKVNPYLRPLFDALGEMMDNDMLKRNMAEDRIEVIPLAYMRGRTLNNAHIILDEAQNTTVAQMKMFLTRMGAHSTITVCGDTTQIDLPSSRQSGLVDALERLRGIEEIAIVRLTGADIVRHRLVQRIVSSYETETVGENPGENRQSQAESRSERPEMEE